MYEPPDDVVAFIASYMNETHAEVLGLIAKAHGFATDRAEVCGMSAESLALRIEEGDERRVVHIPWPAPLRRREDIRLYLQEMQDDARFSG